MSIDYDLARSSGVNIARWLPRKGKATQSEVAHVVGVLRQSAADAVVPVREATGLVASAESSVLVIDRPNWVNANLASLEAMLAPVLAKLPQSNAAGFAGLEAGALLGFLSTRVLGQYDLFGGDRLLLVAPNIWSVSRELDIELQSFARWVAFHEETHRAQLTGVPWLRTFMREQIEALADAVEPQQLVETLPKVVKAITDAVTGQPGISLTEAMQSPNQAAVLERLVGLMALLEGHADVVMDEVAVAHIPEVAAIRAKFEKRRDQRGSQTQEAIKRLIGLDAKLRQYREGASFVRAVRGSVGDEGFAKVWSSPDCLPSATEIAMPDLWINRMR